MRESSDTGRVLQRDKQGSTCGCLRDFLQFTKENVTEKSSFAGTQAGCSRPVFFQRLHLIFSCASRTKIRPKRKFWTDIPRTPRRRGRPRPRGVSKKPQLKKKFWLNLCSLALALLLLTTERWPGVCLIGKGHRSEPKKAMTKCSVKFLGQPLGWGSRGLLNTRSFPVFAQGGPREGGSNLTNSSEFVNVYGSFSGKKKGT